LGVKCTEGRDTEIEKLGKNKVNLTWMGKEIEKG